MTNLSNSFLKGPSSSLQVTRPEVRQNPTRLPWSVWKNSHILTVGEMLWPSFFKGSSSFLQIARTIIEACMSSNFGNVPSLITKYAALKDMIFMPGGSGFQLKVEQVTSYLK